jgi:arsenite methyltransferase
MSERTRATAGAAAALGLATIDEAPEGLAVAQTDAQAQTEEAFGYKWARRDTYDSPAVLANMRRWLVERYLGGDEALLDGWLAGGRKVIVDAGCGAGFSSLLLFGERLHDHDYIGVDISDAVRVARQRFAEAGVPGEFVRASITDLDVPAGSVDMIFSEGVLHHTDSFYVYAKKAVIREFTDDFVREYLRPMSDEEAWAALEPLTRLGEALGRLNVTLDVPEDIPFLGIKRGPIDIQRFFYWNVCKTFYRPDFTVDEMNHINFDWFRPLNCHRQTPEEVRRWCAEAGLEIERMDVQEAGITVVARRPGETRSRVVEGV